LGEIGELDWGNEGFVRRENSLGHAHERDDGSGDFAECRGIGDTFGIPEGIQESHMRSPLARVVVKIEKLVTRERLAAQGEFDFLLVEFGGEFSRDAGEVRRLREEAVFFSGRPEWLPD
jgi:hypothetical protein